MRYFLYLLISLCTTFCSASQNEYSLVYVHLGPKLPKYLPTAISQARLFNSTCPIYLIGNKEALDKFDCTAQNVIPVTTESLPISKHHHYFIKKVKLEGLWRYAIERFLYLDDFIQQYGLTHVFHTENDVMIYFDIGEKLPIFKQDYQGKIATVFDCDERAIPSFVYISDPIPFNKFSKYVAGHGLNGTTDMALFAKFKDFYQTFCDNLPILIPAYAKDYPLTSLSKKSAKSPLPYTNHLDKFNLIFDAAAIGQFLGGIDPIHKNIKRGFVGEMSIFLTHRCQYQWVRDPQGRLIPYISYKEEKYPLANLHIHCKDLQAFYSLNEEPPEVPTTFWSSFPLY